MHNMKICFNEILMPYFYPITLSNMYIKNQEFKDTDTLLEVLFDFEIGDPSIKMQAFIAEVDAALQNNKELNDQAAAMDEEEGMELLDDWKRERVIHILTNNYTSFKVHSAKLYGINESIEDLLYSIDLI